MTSECAMGRKRVVISANNGQNKGITCHLIGGVPSLTGGEIDRGELTNLSVESVQTSYLLSFVSNNCLLHCPPSRERFFNNTNERSLVQWNLIGRFLLVVLVHDMYFICTKEAIWLMGRDYSSRVYWAIRNYSQFAVQRVFLRLAQDKRLARTLVDHGVAQTTSLKWNERLTEVLLCANTERTVAVLLQDLNQCVFFQRHFKFIRGCEVIQTSIVG